MKRIVVYQSKTGFTKQYAEWIAEELNCTAIDIKHVKMTQIQENDQVIFGGWIMGGMISGLNKIRKMNPKNLVVYAVGSTPEDIVDQEKIKGQNALQETPFFYMVGGFQFNKLNFLIRGMLNTMKKSTAKKENKNAEETFMVEHLGTNFDNSDKKYTQELVRFLA
ncbi:flavodoxin domain-containing protein [Anaerosporobacter faecicola]|uniref:flavodoxin domain-containing protein n=1 Tax=Anaerosporobacter faecicola TaxID=2718714 RepID=UPI001439BBFF|nr:flavodoxin domain-containing protein [Anaerosporobacter faecicola]